MRYSQILITLIALLTGACSRTDDLLPENNYSPEAIVFTSPYNVSRSPEMRNSFLSGDNVGVLGYCEAKNNNVDYSSSPWNTKKQFAKPDLFYNQKLTYTNSGTWTYDTDDTKDGNQLEPWFENENYTYAFFAYYPYATITSSYTGTNDDNESMGTIELSSSDATGDPVITYTMPHPAGGSPSSTSLEWSIVPDFMLAYSIDHRKADGPVNLAFRHIFCAFEFEINNYNTTPATINNLRFSGTNFYRSVSVTGQESDYKTGTDRYSGYFNIITTSITCPAATEKDGILIPGNVKITIEDTEEPIDLLFIPDAQGKITEGDCSVNVQIGNESERTQNLKESMSFEPGTRSIFSINLVGNNFVLQVRSDGQWSDGGDSDIRFD
ncbi:MAG: fimbrillin family protein [Marinifilaceae bacterium]|nr:fimbrillin family protein [Marinifilaceae bacterium]